MDPTLLDFSGAADGNGESDGDLAAKEAALHGTFPSASDLEHGAGSVTAPDIGSGPQRRLEGRLRLLIAGVGESKTGRADLSSFRWQQEQHNIMASAT